MVISAFLSAPAVTWSSLPAAQQSNRYASIAVSVESQFVGTDVIVPCLQYFKILGNVFVFS